MRHFQRLVMLRWRMNLFQIAATKHDFVIELIKKKS